MATVVVGVVVLGSAASEAAPGPDPTQLLHAALVDAARSGSVHETIVEDFGTHRGTISEDVTTNSGRQTITNSDGALAHVLILDRVAYISGNQKALASYFGLSGARSRRVGSHWVSIPASNRWYATVAASATLPSALSVITPSGRLTELPAARVAGTPVVRIRGGAPRSSQGTGRETLDLTRSSHPLPAHATVTVSHDGHAGKVVTRLSRWGETVALRAPAGAIPFDRL